MDWTKDEGYDIPLGTHYHRSYPTEVSLVSFTLRLSAFTRKHLYRRLQQAYASGALRLVKRLHARLAFAEGRSVRDVAERLHLGEQTVRDYRNRFLGQQRASFTYKQPPGRPSQLTKTQRRELAALLKAGPQAAGYTSGGWNTPMMQDLIQARFGVASHPHSLATFLHNLGFSSQKVRLVSDHRNEAKRLAWRQTQWPRILPQAQQRQALLLFGAEASCAQWGSLCSPWAPTGAQPDVRTSGTRTGSKVFGLMDSFSGPFFSTAHAGRFPSESSAAFLRDVLSQTRRHVVVIQDGARSHTSAALQRFFDAHAERLTIEPLPAYSPDFHPIEPLGKQVKTEATHLKSFPELAHLQAEVDRALLHFAQTPREITVRMARDCEKLGAIAA
jgi:transposase